MLKLAARGIQREALLRKRICFKFEIDGTCAEGPSFYLVQVGQLLVDPKGYVHVPAGR